MKYLNFLLLDDAYLLIWKMRLNSLSPPTPLHALHLPISGPHFPLLDIQSWWTNTSSQVQLLFWTIRVATALSLDDTLVNAYQCMLVNITSYYILNVVISAFSVYGYHYVNLILFSDVVIIAFPCLHSHMFWLKVTIVLSCFVVVIVCLHVSFSIYLLLIQN